jgi:hypothetical protein
MPDRGLPLAISNDRLYVEDLELNEGELSSRRYYSFDTESVTVSGRLSESVSRLGVPSHTSPFSFHSE